MNLERINKEKLKTETKTFFRSENWKNLLVFFTFVVLAFVFWMLKYYQQKFEIDLTLPIQYDNVPSDIFLSDSLPQKINLKVQDKGTLLYGYIYDKEAIHIDLKTLSLKKSAHTINRSDLNGIIREYLLTTTQLTSFYPESITVKYSALKKKELPVVLDSEITMAPGYILADSISIVPSTVIAYGNAHVIDALREIRTLPLTKQNLSKNQDFSLDLQTPEGTHLATEKVNVAIQVEAYTEKSFELPVVCYNLPEDLYIRFFPSSVEFVSQVALSKYALLTEMDLEVSVDYKTLAQSKTETIPLALSKKPQWLINYRMVPERVEYLIEQKK
jgi:hypothetical protein